MRRGVRSTFVDGAVDGGARLPRTATGATVAAMCRDEAPMPEPDDRRSRCSSSASRDGHDDLFQHTSKAA